MNPPRFVTTEESPKITNSCEPRPALPASPRGDSVAAHAGAVFPIRRLRGQGGRRLPHVELTRHDVRDEAGAVLAEQLDLAAGAVDGGIDVTGLAGERVRKIASCSCAGGVSTGILRKLSG